MDKSKKMPIKGILLVLMVAVILGGLFMVIKSAIVAKNLSAEPAGEALLNAGQGLDEITIEALLNPDKNRLDVSQTMTIENRWEKELDYVVLRTYANAFFLQETSPAATEELFDLCYPQGFSPGGLTFLQVEADGKTLDYFYEDEGKTLMNLPLEKALKPGQKVVIKLNYQVAIPQCAYRFGYSQGSYQLGNVFPTLGVYEQGAWRKDEYSPIGDPFYSHCANYQVTLQVPKGYQAAASGYGVKREKGNLWEYEYSTPAMRDFTLVINKNFLKKEEMVAGTLVSVSVQNSNYAKKMLKYAKQALLFLEEAYGQYPYQQLSLAQVNFPFNGMEYPGLIMLGNVGTMSDQNLEWTVVHEVAHQWWAIVVGSDGINQPWQDEALCEYALIQYIKSTYGQQAKEDIIAGRIHTAMRVTVPRGVTPGSPIHYFADLAEYTLVVYQRGAMAFFMLEEALGEEGLQNFLKAYYNEYAFKIATRKDFEQLLFENTGQDWQGLLTDFLDTEYTY